MTLPKVATSVNKILLLTTDTRVLEEYLLPLYYVVGNLNYFFFLFKIRSSRSIISTKINLYWFFKYKRPLVAVIPNIDSHRIYKILVLLRVPFIVPRSTISPTSTYFDADRMVRDVYAAIRLMSITKIYN